MSDDEEIQRKAVEKYGEEKGLIYMTGYIQGKVDGTKDTIKTYLRYGKLPL